MAEFGIDIFIGANLSRFTQALRDSEAQLQKLALGAGAVFTGLTVPVGMAVKAFAEFEQVMNEIAAVSNLTARQMDQMKAVALAMGAQTKYSAKEAAEGMSELAKAGFTAEQAMKAIPGVLNAAAASGESVARAAEIIGAALNGFGLAADKAGAVADILAKTANLSAVSMNDLGESFKFVSSIAASTSQPIEEIATVLAIMGNNGIKGSQAGTTVRASLVSLVKPSKDAANVLHGLGISIQDTQGKMLPLTDIIGQLREKTASMTEVQRSHAIATIFGSESLSGLLAVMKQTPAQVAEASAAVRDNANAAQEMADVMNRGLGASFEQLMGSVETIAIQFGEQFAPALQATAVAATEVANIISAMDPSTKSFIASYGAAAIAATGLTAAMATLGLAIPLVASGFAALSVLGGPIALGIVGVSTAMGALTYAMAENTRTSIAAKKADEEAFAATVKQVKSNHDRKVALQALVKEHDKLIDKVNLTRAEKKRLHDIQEQLKKQYPGLKTAIEEAGQGHLNNIPAINAETAAMDVNTEATLRNARTKAKLASMNATLAAGAYTIAARARGPLERDAAKFGPLDSFSKSQLDQNAFDMNKKYAEADAAAAAARQANAELAKLEAASKPRPVVTTKTRRGKIVDGAPSRGSSSSKAENQAYSIAKAIAEGNADIAEAINEQAYAESVSFIDKQLALLEHLKEMGLKTEKDYLLELERINADKIRMASKAAQGKLQTELSAVAAEASAARAGGATKAADLVKFEKKADAIRVRIASAQIAGDRQLAALHVDTTNKIAMVDVNSAKEVARVTTELMSKREDAERSLEAVKNARLPLYKRELLEIDATYSHAISKAEEVRNAALKEAAEVEKKGGAYVKLAASIRVGAASMFDLAKQSAEAKKELDLAAVADANAQAFRELQGSLMALAADPSIERIANTIKDIASNPEKMARLGSIVNKMSEDFDNAGGGMSGAALAMEGMAKNIDPISIGMALIMESAKVIANMWESSAKNAERAKNAQLETARLKAENDNDPDAKRKIAVDLLDQEWAAKYKEEKAGLLGRMGVPGFMQGMMHESTYQHNLDLLMQERWGGWYNENLRKIEKQYFDDYAEWLAANPMGPGSFGAGVGDGKPTSAMGFSSVFNTFEDPEKSKEAEAKRMELGSARFDKAQEDARRLGDAYDEALDRLNALDEERNSSERDDAGNKISLKAKYELDVANALLEKEKAITDLLKKEAELRAELVKLSEEEAKNVQAILDEGIAVRAKTETQDKTERINEVRTAAEERRKAINDQLADIEVKRLAEEGAYTSTTNKLKNLYDERKGLIDDEYNRITRNVNVLREELKVQQSLNDAKAGRKAEVEKKGTAGYSERTGPASVGETRKNLGGPGDVIWDGRSWSAVKRHSGGPVPGPAGSEVPIIAMGDEHVYTSQQHKESLDARRLVEMLSRGGGGSTINGGIKLEIHAAPGMSEREVGRVAINALEAKLRGAGFGK